MIEVLLSCFYSEFWPIVGDILSWKRDHGGTLASHDSVCIDIFQNSLDIFKHGDRLWQQDDEVVKAELIRMANATLKKGSSGESTKGGRDEKKGVRNFCLYVHEPVLSPEPQKRRRSRSSSRSAASIQKTHDRSKRSASGSDVASDSVGGGSSTVCCSAGACLSFCSIGR